ncbi:MAG: hypothetical protein Kapaf2KO_15990 [Candidatus Kapaibacteriales bacterium]
MVVAVISNLYSLYLLPARLFDWPLAFLDFSVSTGGERTGGEKLGQIVLSFEGFFRTTSFFSEPSALANFNNINILFYLAHSLVLGRSPFKTKFFTYLFLITWIPSQLFTFSLTAVLLLVGTAISYIFIKGSAFLGRLLKIVFYFALFAVIADVIQATITGISVIELFYTRIAGILDIAGSAGIVGESAFDRFYSYEQSWLIWYNYPFFGTGLGLTYLNGLYDVTFLHNSISAVLAETGLWGLISYLALQLIVPSVMIYNSRKIIRTGFHLNYRTLSVLYMFFATVSLCLALLNMFSLNAVISEWYWFIMSFTVIVHLSYLRAKIKLPLHSGNRVSLHSAAS